MPPATTRSGTAMMAIVMARLVHSEKDCGVKPFLVQIADGKQMCTNITSK